MRILSLFLVVFALTGCSGTTIGGNEDQLTPAYLKQHVSILVPRILVIRR